ncbi:MAG: hypothetical protein JSW50_01380, partial [Candidatus Latescibacterota bacterium]
MNPAIPTPPKTTCNQLIVLPLLLAAAVLSGAPPTVCADDKPAAFETVTFGVQFVATVAKEKPFGDLWDPSNGG